MTTHTTPVNRQSALFLSKKKRVETVQEAIDGAVKHLLSGRINEQLAAAFTGQFGTDPCVTYKISFRRDPKEGGKFTYQSHTHISHEISEGVALYGLKP